MKLSDEHEAGCTYRLWQESPQRVSRPPACDCAALDPILYDAAAHLRDAELPTLAAGVELARLVVADARTLAEAFAASAIVLCICGEGSRVCACGNDLAQDIERRIREFERDLRVEEAADG